VVAGLNSRARIYRQNAEADDVVGGAVLSGTVQFGNVLTRLESNPIEQLLLQQGLETVRTYNALVQPGTLDIRERDEYEIYQPFDHKYFGLRLRIVGVQGSSHNARDRRNYIRLTLVRSVRAHASQ
jgi:hypothetical protein